MKTVQSNTHKINHRVLQKTVYKNIHRKKLKQQQGMVVLLMSLIILLVITILGVSAVKTSTSGTQISGNIIYSTLVFQGAESALNKVLSDDDYTNLDIAASARSATPTVVDAAYFTPSEIVFNGIELASDATIVFDKIFKYPPINGVANSSDISYQVFRIEANSKINNTGARDRHTEGRAIPIPQ